MARKGDRMRRDYMIVEKTFDLDWLNNFHTGKLLL